MSDTTTGRLPNALEGPETRFPASSPEAVHLRTVLPLGSILYTCSRGVSRSGRQERLSVFVPLAAPDSAALPAIHDVTREVVRAIEATGSSAGWLRVSISRGLPDFVAVCSGWPVSECSGRDLADHLGEVLYGTTAAFHHRAL